MQYVRNISDSVSTAWNSINPATLSGAIDVIVVELADGSYACSPFHVRFGKFSLLRPYEKKVEFRVNGVKQDYSMKLGEGGEAFFIFETTERIPESMQTSPLVSPANSPPFGPDQSSADLQDPDLLELDDGESDRPRRPSAAALQQPHGMLTPVSTSPNMPNGRPASADWGSNLMRPHSEGILRHSARATERQDEDTSMEGGDADRCPSPPALGPKEATERALTISNALSAADIPSKVTDAGDLMLDMSGFKSSEEDMLRAEVLARKILAEELEGNYDIGALFGFDEEGNLWIYSSEEAKRAAMDKTIESSLHSHRHSVAADAISDPGYQSDGSDVTHAPHMPSHRRSESDAGPMGLQTPPRTPTDSARATAREPNRNYAKTLRLTSEQLKDLELRSGENSMSFTVNRATCSANMYLWKHGTPVVISDIDGTITKSDALGHVLNMIGRDWTHSGIAKLYSDIAMNGYNIMYLTSRSVGQADTTRAYLNNIVQEGCRMPHGPTILSPDRTMAALRREVYLRKPHVFKMATLRDISNLYGPDKSPFYAGFGNRLTDQISYRTVDVSRNRIFTINSNSEVSLDLLSLNKLKMSYVNINEVVDHYFPPVGMLVSGGGEDYTDFKYWRDNPLDLDDFSASGSDEPGIAADIASTYSEDDDEDIGDGLAESYMSRESIDETNESARLQRRRLVEAEHMSKSITESFEDDDDDDADDEEPEEESESEEEEDDDDDDDDEDEESDEETEAISSYVAPKSTEPLVPLKDATAEVITGVGNLSLGRAATSSQ